MTPSTDEDLDMPRLRCVIHGAVQGVGFRPFVYRLANEHELRGWVLNDAAGVQVEVEGERAALTRFRTALVDEAPPLAVIHAVEMSWLAPVGFEDFVIRESRGTQPPTVLVLPDVATCAACRAEIATPENRRHGYPFTNCTDCGPRYSIIRGLPYDRPLTAMADFALCGKCNAEYRDPANRRFHAQPNACPDCGPQIALWDGDGRKLASRGAALRMAAEALRAGRIVALKGLGGFQLLVDARDVAAVRRLRERKGREAKPLALMFPSLAAVRETCAVSEAEARLLSSPQAPIVLLRRTGNDIAADVAPENPRLGVMLPYTPLHYLLLAEVGFPVVATSGNLSDEPMAIANDEALERLAGIADLWLVHDRPIVRHVDDSIVRVHGECELVLRRARGYAPLPLVLSGVAAEALAVRPVLAVGAHMKNAVALTSGARVFLSQHIGDLATPAALEAFERVIADLAGLLVIGPAVVACDLHPDYQATRFAHRYAGEHGLPLVEVQHHHAHIAAAMAENQVAGEVLGLAWDGTGHGTDGTVWGGEFFMGGYAGFRRVGHLRTFPLPGGDLAARETRRPALGLLFAAGMELRQAPGFTEAELATLRGVLRKGVNAPTTSSMGRLFDAVAAFAGVRLRNRYEGEAPMALEHLLGDDAPEAGAYPIELVNSDDGFIADWEPLVVALLADRTAEVAPPEMAARFHNALVDLALAAAERAGCEQVVLSGGSFQNFYLSERITARLTAAGFRVFAHQRVPPNDGGIALGQAVLAAFADSLLPDSLAGG